MKLLKELFEGILDKDNKVKVGASMDESTKEIIREFIIDNFWAIDMKISDFPVDGKWIVYATNVYLENKKLKSLTNGMFVWGNDIDRFICKESDIESLEGAPRQCRIFDCSKCNNLKTLEGAPEQVETLFCDECKNLVSLKGCPIKLRGFDCSGCDKLKTLKYLPKHGATFYCTGKKPFDIDKEMKYINDWEVINF